jgi:8-oxo-dGTP pyrophosphatase MutT (NUDIX family)
MDIKLANSQPGCGGFVVIYNSQYVLLVKTPEGKWGFPKGKIEKKFNEDLLKCAFRELKEETGLTSDQIIPYKTDTVWFDEITKQGMHSVRLYVAVIDRMINPVVSDTDELAEAKWVKIDDAYKCLTIKNRAEILSNALNIIKKEKN